MNSYFNSHSANFLAACNTCSLESKDDRLTERCTFNFNYFTVQSAGQDFADWKHRELVALLNHLKDYSNFPLKHWTKQPIGKSGAVLIIYGGFPKKSEFTHPNHVPHQARWGRFRLTHAKRLVGFVVPENLDGQVHPQTGERFCSNTFYVVFLDADHRFWASEAK